jgi:hypothetical protein
MYQRTPKGDELRSAFDRLKHKREDELEQMRIAKFGPLRNADRTARKKLGREIDEEKTHREKVMAECDAWSLDKARTIFYGAAEAEGRNPWHADVSNTMFWM